jgi:phosphohistidine phosphatase SixA
MAAYLRRAKIAPVLVICSTAMRAQQTLDPIAKAKKPPKASSKERSMEGRNEHYGSNSGTSRRAPNLCF